MRLAFEVHRAIIEFVHHIHLFIGNNNFYWLIAIYETNIQNIQKKSSAECGQKKKKKTREEENENEKEKERSRKIYGISNSGIGCKQWCNCWQIKVFDFHDEYRFRAVHIRFL